MHAASSSSDSSARGIRPATHFAGWSGDCSGTGPCVVDFDRARFVGANFETQADLFANDFE
jgi:hypothetical protein